MIPVVNHAAGERPVHRVDDVAPRAEVAQDRMAAAIRIAE